MSSVIKLLPNNHGIYRYIEYVDLSLYPNTDWLHNPDISSLSNVDQKYWKVSGSPQSVLEMSQSEKDIVDNDILDHENSSVAGTLIFEKNGKCKNKWLGMGSSKTSDMVPFIIPNPMTITAMTFTNRNNSVDTDVEVYKNGTKIHTWEIRDKRWAWITKGLYSLSFVAGDKFGIYMRDKGTDPKHVIITFHYTIWNHEVGEGGSSTL